MSKVSSCFIKCLKEPEEEEGYSRPTDDICSDELLADRPIKALNCPQILIPENNVSCADSDPRSVLAACDCPDIMITSHGLDRPRLRSVRGLKDRC
jgi:hypothetical protein